MTNDYNSRNDTENDLNDIAGKSAGAIRSAGKIARAATNNAAKNTAQNVAKETAKGMAKGAAEGTAAGPVGIIVGVLASVTKDAAKNFVGTLDTANESKKESNSALSTVIICAAFLFAFLFIFCGALLTKGMPSLVSNGQETEFEVTKGSNLSAADERYKENASSEFKDFNDDYPLSNTIMDYIWGTSEKKGFRQVLNDAINENLKATVMSLGNTVSGKQWDQDRTLDYFYEQPWPYDVQVNNYEVCPTIKDVFSGGYKAKYDDVNWAEVLTILSQNTSADSSHQYALNWGECNYEDFLSFIETDRCKQYMYELGIKWIPIYTHTSTVTNADGTTSTETLKRDGSECDTAEACSQSPQTQNFDGIDYEFTDFWCKTEVRPFGLRELYALADVAPEDYHAEFDQHTNYEMLDYSERIVRIYQRGKKVTFESGGSADQLGPSYDQPRSQRSTIYSYLTSDQTLIDEDKAGKGRSCWYYIKDTYNKDLESIGYTQPEYESSTPPDSELLSGTLMERLAYYFPDGLPTSAAEMQQYLTTVAVECLDANGNIVTRNITVHKKAAESIQNAMHELAQSGFVVKGIGSYNWRDMVGASGKRSMHSYGLAIDINAEDNPFIKNNKVLYGTTWDPSTNEYAIDQNDANILIKHGWYWGGNWHSSKDYMHFSVTDY